MLISSLGLTVLSKIPSQAVTGLLTGQLKLTGGVLRWAAGTGKGGQIFMHLLPAGNSLLNMVPGLDFIPGLVANFQLHKISGKIDTLQQMTQLNTYQLINLTKQVTSLSQATQQVLSVATGAAVLSGLSLAVSSVGFMVVNKKLNTIDKRLKEIQKDVQAIREFLQRAERAELLAALGDLLKIDGLTDEQHRHTMLHNARLTLARINQRYRDLLVHSNSINEAMANEEYFSLTALAQARCTAELGMFDIARRELEEMNLFWKAQARRIAKDFLIGEFPERFLASDFADDVPVSALIAWLDFVGDEEKGYEWIDVLRHRINEPWYGKKFWKNDGGGLNRGIGVGLEKEQQTVIPTLQKLISRNGVFDGYLSQYEMFEQHKVRPSEFQDQLLQLPEEKAVNGYYMLQPAKTA